MTIYHDIVYNRKEGTYPKKLVDYLYNVYMKKPFWSLLDYGCGTGTYTELWKTKYVVSGVDNEINFEKDKLPFQDNSFGFVFSKSVIEHVSNTQHMLAEAYRVLHNCGKIVVMTPAWEYNYKDFYNDPTHIKPFHRKGLQDALKMAGFQEVEVMYFYQLPWLWEKPYLFPIVKLMSLFSRFKWKDSEETQMRPNIRFSQEVQLLAIGKKLVKT